MITCQRLAELCTDYVEGKLGLGERLRFELHLGLCQDCRDYLKQLRVARAAMGHLPPPTLSAETRAELLRRLAGWRDGGRG